MSLLKKIFNKKTILYVTGITTVFAIALYLFVFKYLGTMNPDGIWDKKNIQHNLLSSEVRVYYNDEVNLLGAFFEDSHRRYVVYDSIPKQIIEGLIAGEDKTFWDHDGYDPRGIARAIIKYVTTGKKQGGSTLSQQTTKNLLKIHKRNVFTKIKELIHTLQLEYWFSKEEILEFYLNQFYVSGNGKGVSIAARYFFDKELKDLTLLECAFIAGSVKGPTNYDVFIKRTPESKSAALKKAQIRTQYILDRMKIEGYISEEIHKKTDVKNLAFKKGSFKNPMATPLDWVYSKLKEPVMDSIFKSHDLEQWENAGIKVVTHLDYNVQKENIRNVRHHLGEVDLKLGNKNELPRDKESKYSSIEKNEFAYARVDSVIYEKKTFKGLSLVMGQVHGIVPAKSVLSYYKKIRYYIKSQSKLPAKPDAKTLNKLFKNKVIYVQATKVGQPNLFRIENRPELSGANYLIHEGKVISAVNGPYNYGYDRIREAERQFGSTWKPLVYSLAIQYGWDYLDSIDNEYRVFKYSTSFYYPKPDHSNKGDDVSIMWAATRSENIASIHLLIDLLNKIRPSRLYELAKQRGYTRLDKESDQEYKKRLDKQFKLNLNKFAKFEISFSKAKGEFEADLIFDQKHLTIKKLKSLWSGIGYSNELKRLNRKPGRKKLLIEQLEHNFQFYKKHVALIDKAPHQFTVYRHSIDDRKSFFTRKPAAGIWVSDDLSFMESTDDVYINDFITLGDWKRFEAMVSGDIALKEALQFENLMRIPDFKTSLSLQLFVDYAKELGINRELDKVLSLPLGVNSVTLEEMTHAYESMIKGYKYKSDITNWNEGIVIDKIFTNEGKLIFENNIHKEKILDDKTVQQMQIMLYSVGQNGTGRSALSKIRVYRDASDVFGISYPFMGKTGTTNQFKNASFIGALAGWNEEINAFDFHSSLVIGSYVGFDDNKKLSSPRFKGSGATASLPVWAGAAQVYISQKNLSDHVDFDDIDLYLNQKISPSFHREIKEVKLDAMTGSILGDESTGSFKNGIILSR